jgi:hypothetical protein
MIGEYCGRLRRLLLTPLGLTICGLLMLLLANQSGEVLRNLLFVVGGAMAVVGWGWFWARRMNLKRERDDKEAVTRPPDD